MNHLHQQPRVTGSFISTFLLVDLSLTVYNYAATGTLAIKRVDHDTILWFNPKPEPRIPSDCVSCHCIVGETYKRWYRLWDYRTPAFKSLYFGFHGCNYNVCWLFLPLSFVDFNTSYYLKKKQKTKNKKQKTIYKVLNTHDTFLE